MLTSHELFGFMSPALGVRIIEFAHDENRELYRTALNAVGSMRLLEHFDEAYYQRVLGRRARLNLWVPPTGLAWAAVSPPRPA